MTDAPPRDPPPPPVAPLPAHDRPARPDAATRLAYLATTRYRPHEAQRRFHASAARFKVLIAGARFGKSLAAAREVEADVVLGRATRGWIVGPTYALAEKEFRYLVRHIQEREIPLAEFRYSPREMYVRLTQGSEFAAKSADRPAGLLGEELDWLILAEAAHLRPEAWHRYLRPRLASREGRLIVPTTPRGFNWVYDLYQQGRARAGRDWESFHFPSGANPHLSRADLAEARESMAEHAFAEQYEGRFVSPAGRVYPSFARATHARELRLMPWHRRYRAIDAGFRNPFVCLWVADLGDGRLHVFDEYYAQGRPTREHLTAIARHADRIALTVVDPAAAQLIEDLRAAGVAAVGGLNHVAEGIELVRRALETELEGMPALTVHPRCELLCREFEHYRYPEDRGLGPRSELPQKRDDHGLDALRYLLLTLARRVRWERIDP